MGKKLKKVVSTISALSIAAAVIPVIPMSASAAPETSKFDPETVMWTDNKIENVLAQKDGDRYETVRDVNPNADKNDSGVQNPYASDGDTYNNWEYAEFVWTNYYPVGNGRMAGMVAGGIDNEVIQINEDTCWDGSPYGTLKNEDGETITTLEETNAAEKITTEDPTSGSVPESWRYYRGADPDTDAPAEIGSEEVLVGDEQFRSEYPEFANQSISNQALNINNAEEQEAVQDRWSMERMVEATFLGSPNRQRAYKSFVEVYLDFNQEHEKADNYTKSLDMETGIVTVDYDYEGSHFKRETFASYPDQVVVTHVESDNDLNFDAELHTYHEKDGYYSYEKVADNEVKLTAAISNGSKDNNEVGTVNAIKFEARMFLDGDDGAKFSVSDDNRTVTVTGGKEANIYVVGATNYVDYLTLDNTKQGADCDRYENNVKSRTYEEIKERHLADFTEQFNRTDLNLENSEGVDYSDTPTEQRVRKDINGESGFLTGAASRTSDANKNGVYTTYSEGDNQLAALEFNYGKYLILCGSRDGREASDGEIAIQESQPLNLTGKWNAAFSASWNGKYTININTEMNYWAAQPLNIGDSERPLIDTFDELARSGSITAANQYAVYDDDGVYQPGDPWVMHHNYDLWRGTQPIDNATAGLWPTGGIWLLDHAWQYYQFNKDTEYLAEVYPYMIGAAKFFTQFLVVDPKTGYLITAASCSPEQGGVQPGPAMDTQLVRNLYDMVEQASEILGKTEENAELLSKIAEQMPSSYLADEEGKLAPNLIDDNGYIQEWVRGDVTFDISERDSGQWEVTNPFTNETVRVYNHGASNAGGHRHCSHLWEFFPGTHISAYSDDPDEQALFKAFQKTTSAKGTGSGQGWGLAWRINLNARALDGNNASKMLEQLFTTRTSPNLFDQHPNFQIDGNYGATSGIIEMLIQSHDGTINLLPALPDQWQSGSFKGFNTREGATVDLAWSDGQPTEAKLHVRESGDMNIRTKYASEAKVYDESGEEVETTLNTDGNLLTFNVEAGKTYTINNFGTNIVENDKVYKAADVTEFYASDNGTLPKIDGNGVEIGYIYNRENVKIGYAVNDVDFDGLQALTLNMPKVRKDNTYVSITLDTPEGTEIVNQPISTGINELELKNISDVKGKHKIYILYYRDPYANDDKYIANAGDLVASYKKIEDPQPPVNTPVVTEEPSEYAYEIDSAYFGNDGKLNISIKGESEPAKLIVASYNNAGALEAIHTEDINGNVDKAIDFAKPENGLVKVFVWDALDTMKPLSVVAEAAMTEPTMIPSTTAPSTTAPSTTAPSTAEPTTQPTEEPSSNAVYIGSTKYNSIREAVAAAEENAPSSEEERVYIDIMPGTYREQVYVSAPYITLRKMPGTEGEAKITWYYGLGSLYDSCNDDGYYDPSVIGDGKSNAPKDWGSSLKVDKKATGFTAENLTLENSYNMYYTQEELTDITGYDPDTNNSDFRRLDWIKEQISKGVSDDEINNYLKTREDITYKGVTSSPRERCCALNCSADKAVFIGCTVMSTQDTIGINSGRMYFKDCVLGGTTDYICGSATAVFDNCELYANATGSGDSATITAPSNPIESDGYLFYNCRVTGSEDAEQGIFGRPWSGVNASANYINTIIDNRSGSKELLISNAGWTSMGGIEPKDARFHEYGSKNSSGEDVDTSGRPKSTLLDEWTMLRYNPLVFTEGEDGWDPAGLSSRYEGVRNVLDTAVIDTSDADTNEIELPQAPEGYEYKWESNSEFAIVSEDGQSINLIRPAYGEEPIDATVKLYVREADNKEIGAEKSIEFEIAPTNDTENVFTLTGKVTLSSESENEQTISILIKKGDAVIKTENVVFEPGETEKEYTAENIPEGTYTVYPSTLNAEYNISTEPAEITAMAGDTKEYNVEVNKMANITVESPDFDGQGYKPFVNSANGFSAEIYTATGDETANLGEGNTVYKLTKEEGTTVSKNTGVSFDIMSMLPEGSSLKNTKTLRFSFDLLMESINYLPSDYSYFDLATSTDNGGNDAPDQTRFVRCGVHNGWKQLNFFPAANNRINGDKTQFNKNNNMANKWYRIVEDIDLENKTITVTAYDRDKDMEMLNGKPFTIAMPDENGDNLNYPTDINLDNLYFNIYMDKKENTSNKLEYYIDNITLEYQDFE